jgi:AraC family transcriptional regulator of adaptative response/methylated-DNA-[protein]-cysteine methyltransferase
MTYLSPNGKDSLQWQAVTSRDSGADGRFVYAVKTTGIFCRPSCRSRVPSRHNVEFYQSVADAERAGYRPCLRCRPTEVGASKAASRLIVKACRSLETDESIRSEDVARLIGLSPSYFSRFFRKYVGITPQEYRRRILAERARKVLNGALTVTEAAYSAGYSSTSRFYDGVGRELGMKPRQAKLGATGHEVCYAVRACSLGRLLVAWTVRGVCKVAFGDRDEELVALVFKRFPKATLARRLEVPSWVGDILDQVETGRDSDIPLDIQGTAFQERVWQELRRIPSGETRSYQEIACAIGQPLASRAVARACADNNVAVLVPCHRVVRSDGALSGYRWGSARKRKLLDREKKAE